MNIRDMFRSNLQMKFLSLFLAANIWLFVFFETVDEIEIPLSVNFVNTPSGFTAESKTGHGILIRIEGKRMLLLRQNIKGASVTIDLSAAALGSRVFTGYERSTPLIKGVKVVGVSKPSLEINIVRSR